MIYIHVQSNQEDIVSITENKLCYHTISNQLIYHEYVPYFVMLVNLPVLTDLPPNEVLKLDNLNLQGAWPRSSL